jgi:Domain of unknown function (DUF4440)
LAIDGAARIGIVMPTIRKSQWLAGGLTTVLAINIAFGTPPTDHTADIAQLTESVCEMGRAYARQDLAKLDELSAPDYVQTDTRGGVLKRAEYLEFVRNRKSKLSIECDNIEVRLYGEAAVVIGGWTYTKQRPEGDLVTRTRWTSVWTKVGVTWKRHVFQNTYVNPEADHCAMDAAAGKSAANSVFFWMSRSRRLNTVRIALIVCGACVAGCIFAWLPVAALCSLPGLRYSNACGHNAVYWFILTLPLGFIFAALLASRLYAK